MNDVLAGLAPRVLGALVRRHGSFDACEDAVQEALVAAAVQWPQEGVPDNPVGWLIRVATRRLVDARRSETARQQREVTVAALTPADQMHAPPADAPGTPDDTLTLLFLCCHPAVSPLSQAALTLRAVGGLTTAQIARAFLVPEATVSRRITRAKQRIKAAGSEFRLPPEGELEDRLAVVLQVLYLIFNEGYAATTGAELNRPELITEAVRLTRELHRLLPGNGEVTGLLALMLLTEARRPARSGADGSLIPLGEQDRSRWNRDYIDEGVKLITGALSSAPLGVYQLQAAIAAVHDEAALAEDTDWPQILVLYRLLAGIWPNPVVQLNEAIAVAMVHGPHAGLAVLEPLVGDVRMADGHRLHAVRAHLLEMAGEHDAARDTYELAARRATSLPERRYLERRVARLS